MRRKPYTTRRSVLTATGALSVLGLAGVASGDESADGEETPDGDAVSTSEEAPEDNDGPAFPTIGDNDDAPTATVYSNLKCPYTEEFVSENLVEVIDEFVATGRLNLRFCNLSYRPGDSSTPYISDSDPRIAAVELAVWDEDPGSYWEYFFETYTDSPSGYVGYDELESRASAAGVPNVDAVIERARNGEYDAEVEEVADLAADAEIAFSPQLELSGETIAPHHDTESLLGWIDARLEAADAGGGQEEEEEPAEEQPDESGEQSDEAEEQPDEADERAEDVDERPDEADEAGNESQESDEDADSEYENTEYDETESEAADGPDDAGDSEDESEASDGPSFGDSDAGDDEIGAGIDYDLDGDRTVDDLPIDCD